MKSDQEFLEGIYAKARRIAAEESAAAYGKRPLQRLKTRWVALAALLVLAPAVVLSSLYLAGSIGYRKIDIVRSVNFIDFQMLAAQSDMVVQGRFIAYSPGVYQETENSLYTDALFQIEQSFKGQAGGLISIRLQGGKDPVKRVYADLEISRSAKTTRLLFLKQDAAGFYRLFPNGSSCFDAANKPGTFMNRDQVDITSDQIMKIIKGDE